ncbi:MAG TPA: hypothetical protein VF506_07240 [Streptosporangiaceae bacterium]
MSEERIRVIATRPIERIALIFGTLIVLDRGVEQTMHYVSQGGRQILHGALVGGGYLFWGALLLGLWFKTRAAVVTHQTRTSP